MGVNRYRTSYSQLCSLGRVNATLLGSSILRHHPHHGRTESVSLVIERWTEEWSDSVACLLQRTFFIEDDDDETLFVFILPPRWILYQYSWTERHMEILQLLKQHIRYKKIERQERRDRRRPIEETGRSVRHSIVCGESLLFPFRCPMMTFQTTSW